MTYAFKFFIDVFCPENIHCTTGLQNIKNKLYFACRKAT